MRAKLVAVASLLLAVSASRPGRAMGAPASQETIDRYENWAEGKSLRIALGAAAHHDDLPYALLTGAGGAGASAGSAAAVAIDALVLSWDTRRMQPERAASAWSPRFSIGPQAVTAGLGGVF